MENFLRHGRLQVIKRGIASDGRNKHCNHDIHIVGAADELRACVRCQIGDVPELIDSRNENHLSDERFQHFVEFRIHEAFAFENDDGFSGFLARGENIAEQGEGVVALIVARVDGVAEKRHGRLRCGSASAEDGAFRFLVDGFRIDVVLPGKFVNPRAALRIHRVEFLESVLVLHDGGEILFDGAEEIGVLLRGGPDLAREDEGVLNVVRRRVGGAGGAGRGLLSLGAALGGARRGFAIGVELLPVDEIFAGEGDGLDAAIAPNLDVVVARRAVLLERGRFIGGAVVDVALGGAAMAAREKTIAASLAEFLGCLGGATAAVAGSWAGMAAEGKLLAADFSARNRFGIRRALHLHFLHVAASARAFDDLRARRALAEVAVVLEIVVAACALARARLVADGQFRAAGKRGGKVLGAATAGHVFQDPVRALRARAGVARERADVPAEELAAADFVAAMHGDGGRIRIAAVRAADLLALVAPARHHGAARLVADELARFEAADLLLRVVTARTRRVAFGGAAWTRSFVAERFALVQSARQHFPASIVAGRNRILARRSDDVRWQRRLAARARVDDGGIGQARRAVSLMARDVALAVAASLRLAADDVATERGAAAGHVLGDLVAEARHLDLDVARLARPVVALGFTGVESAVEELVADAVAGFLRIRRAADVRVGRFAAGARFLRRLEFAGRAGTGMARNRALVRATVSTRFAADFTTRVRRDEGIDFRIDDLVAKTFVLLGIIVHGVAGGAAELGGECRLAGEVTFVGRA